MDQSAVKPMPTVKLKQDPLERKPGVFLGGLPLPSTAKRHTDRMGRPQQAEAAVIKMLQEMQAGARKPFGTSEHEQTVAAPDVKPIEFRPIQPSSIPITEGGSGGISLIPTTEQPSPFNEMFRRMMEQGSM